MSEFFGLMRKKAARTGQSDLFLEKLCGANGLLRPETGMMIFLLTRGIRDLQKLLKTVFSQ